MEKRILCLFLGLVLFFQMMPITSFAKGEGEGERITLPFKCDMAREGYRYVDMGIHWNWGLFEESAEKYNNDLAVAALILSANCQETTDDVIRETLERMGFGKIQSYYYEEDYNEVDRIAYAIGSVVVEGETKGREKWKDGKDGKAADSPCNYIVVVCRGSTVAEDWLSNLGFNDSGSPLEGFWNAGENVHESLVEYLKTAEIDTSIETKLFITGHSRGGAAANILGTLTNEIAPPENTYVYTFASTNTTEEYLPGEYRHIVNLINQEDAIPCWTLGDYKFGRYIVFHRERNPEMPLIFSVLTGGLDLESMVQTGNLENLELLGSGWPRVMRPHAPSVYMSYLLSRDGETALWEYEIRGAEETDKSFFSKGFPLLSELLSKI